MTGDRSIIKWGNVPVPYAALWSAEEGKMTVDFCRHIKHLACCDAEARGAGKPIFGKPHMGRQRELIVNNLCDLCARPLKGRTKVSLSHARVSATGAEGACVMQVEPLVHKDCALVCVQHCPSLKRDIKAGTLFVRQVLKHRYQIALLATAAVQEFCAVSRDGVAGHAKVELQRWKERDLSWLEQQ